MQSVLSESQLNIGAAVDVKIGVRRCTVVKISTKAGHLTRCGPNEMIQEAIQRVSEPLAVLRGFWKLKVALLFPFL